MKAEEAKTYMGKRCAVTHTDSQGVEVTEEIQVQDVAYVPLYGTYLIGDSQDISIDRVTKIAAQT